MAEEAGWVNVYTCQAEGCTWRAVTKNRDAGTTPFMIGCQRPGCTGVCCSGLYLVPQDLQPTHEWFRPNTASERKKITSEDIAEHVNQGGLLLRKLATGKVGD